jgi:hypothetical protein
VTHKSETSQEVVQFKWYKVFDTSGAFVGTILTHPTLWGERPTLKLELIDDKKKRQSDRHRAIKR